LSDVGITRKDRKTKGRLCLLHDGHEANAFNV